MKEEILKTKKTEIHTKVKEQGAKEINKGKVFENSKEDMPIEFLTTGIPIGYPVNTVVQCNVVDAPNAQVYGGSNVPLRYLNGSEVSGGYASPGNDIKILEIFEGMLLVLVPVGSGAEGDGQWVIGYMEVSTLGDTVWINANTITWNSGDDIPVYDSNNNLIYTLPATQPIQYLYETPNGDYRCILFNGNSGALETGYVSTYSGTFSRGSYLPSSPYASTPGISGDGQNDGGEDDAYQAFLEPILSLFGFKFAYVQDIYTMIFGEYTVTASREISESVGGKEFVVDVSNKSLGIDISILDKFDININGRNILFGITEHIDNGEVKIAVGIDVLKLIITKNLPAGNVSLILKIQKNRTLIQEYEAVFNGMISLIDCVETGVKEVFPIFATVIQTGLNSKNAGNSPEVTSEEEGRQLQELDFGL